MRVSAEWQVWTATETRHLLRSDPAGATGTVTLSAARNEWVSFQILVRSDEPVKAVGVVPGDMHGPFAAKLRATDARLYRQHQLPLETGTHRNTTFKPDWYPDPLIPFAHPKSGAPLSNARLRAIPFELPANDTHGFWVDLYVPTNALPGEYRGTYRVTADYQKAIEIPVTLTVWNFSLPPTPTLVTAFGSPAGRLQDFYRQRTQAGEKLGQTDWAAVESQCAEMLSEHRFNATPPAMLLQPGQQADGTFQFTSPQVQMLRDIIDRYHINAIQTPHPSSAVKDPVTERDRLHAWLAAFDQMTRELKRPHVVFYTYLKDEPNTLEDYRYVQTWGRAVRAAKSAVQVMVVEQPWTEPGKGGADSTWGDLFGAVDIWCPLFSLHRQDDAVNRQALGETIWTYTALCQGAPTPWWHIDYPLLNYRVPAWMAWRDGMKGLLYWGGMSYWRRVDDPWTEAPYYAGSGKPQQGQKGIVFMGEGSLVYPARAVGYDGIVPTLRLKALRDAIEDYDYLVLAQRLGKGTQASELVRGLTETWFQWNQDPSAWERARSELAAWLAAGSPPR